MQCYMLFRPVVFNSTITSDLKWKNSSVCLCKRHLPQFKVLEFGKGVRTLNCVQTPYKSDFCIIGPLKRLVY